MWELILHLLGDYVFQSDWMAQGKTANNIPAACHAMVYTTSFVTLTHSEMALFVIFFSHFLIDRFRLAKYVVYIKNFIFAPPSAWLITSVDSAEEGDELLTIQKKYKWSNCSATGYPSETPPFLSVWLLIIADNTLHLLINHLSLNYL